MKIMPSIEDKEYVRLCANIASHLSISISSARKKVELLTIKNKTTKIEAAEKFLQLLNTNSKQNSICSAELLDELMEALQSEENFLTED